MVGGDVDDGLGFNLVGSEFVDNTGDSVGERNASAGVGPAVDGGQGVPTIGALGSVDGCPVVAGARLVTVYSTLEVKGPLEEVAGSGVGFGVASRVELDAKADGGNVGIEYVGVVLDDDDSEDTGGPIGDQVVSARDGVGDATGSAGRRAEPDVDGAADGPKVRSAVGVGEGTEVSTAAAVVVVRSTDVASSVGATVGVG